MASLIDTLVDVLDKENTEYNNLLAMSKDKTSAIVNGDVEKLQEILLSEQKYIDAVNKLDEKRAENVKDICNVLNIKSGDLKVDALIKMLEKQPKEKAALQEVHLKLKSTIDQLMKINENNKVLLKESMDMIDFELNLARNSVMAPQTANYSKGAYEQDVSPMPGAGMFDAKQ